MEILRFDGKGHPIRCIVHFRIRITRIVFLILRYPAASYRETRPFFPSEETLRKELGLGTRLSADQ